MRGFFNGIIALVIWHRMGGGAGQAGQLVRRCGDHSPEILNETVTECRQFERQRRETVFVYAL
jgi:hypothetical protein